MSPNILSNFYDKVKLTPSFHSSGGTVYHDEGNLNCSFLMESSLYNRRRNLQLVVDALKSQWNVPLSINNRDDILYQDKHKVVCTYFLHLFVKFLPNIRINELDLRATILLTFQISGTASKLAGKKTYHHFTLLFNVDKDRLQNILQSNLVSNIQ